MPLSHRLSTSQLVNFTTDGNNVYDGLEHDLRDARATIQPKVVKSGCSASARNHQDVKVKEEAPRRIHRNLYT